jgi:MYXO-CTERM domain-containing protein
MTCAGTRVVQRAILVLPLALVIAIPEASAEVNRCATADTDIAFNGNDFVNFNGDTGWFPSGSPGQLRLTARVAGKTEVSSGYTATGCWGDGMKATLAPKAGSGNFEVAYGAELALYGRFHVSVIGLSLNWEGRIDIPYIPDDLLIADKQAFTPRLAATTASTLSDSTQPVNVISTNLLSQIVSLGGVSGGIYVSVKGSMTSTFKAAETTVLAQKIATTMDSATIAQPETGFHSTVAVPIEVKGVVRYAPKLTFATGLNIKLLGIQVLNWDIASLTMTLPALERTVAMAGPPASLELPEVDGLAEGARMDFSSGTTQVIHVKNTGGAELQLEPTDVPAGVTVSPLKIAAGAEGDLSVTASESAVAGGVVLTMATNDPDHPSMTIALDTTGGTDGGADDGVSDDDEGIPAGGCGCQSGRADGTLVLVFALGLVLFRRRRRTAA